MIGIFLLVCTIILFLFIIFINMSFILAYILDIVLVALGGGYVAYMYIVPFISSDEAKWIWTVVFGIIFCIIYVLFYLFISIKFEVIGKAINFIISTVGSLAFLIAIKLLFDSLYTAFYLKQKEGIVHFKFFKNDIFDYILYLIIILIYAYVIYKAREEVQENILG